VSARTSIDVDGAAALAAHTTRLLADGHRLALVAAHDDSVDGSFRVVYLFTARPPDRRTALVLRADPTDPRIPSLAGISFPASRFEREMRDLYGIEPLNHPQPRPLVHHPHWPNGCWYPMRRGAGPRPPLQASRPFPFLTVAGDGVYEIPVGPVHAGLIEPGHFRFSVVGETILKLKARLWYVHKGIEKLAEGKGIGAALALAERISGDTAVGQALAFVLAVEDALGIGVSDEVARMRAALLELERRHNHVADLGALCNDVAFGIAHAHTQRIREGLLRMNKATTGHRLLRDGIVPGGASLRNVPDPAEIRRVVADLADIVRIALDHSVIRERFTGTGVLTRQQASDVGALGYVAKASGLPHDARVAHPFCDLGDALRVPVHTAGDVLARFQVRAEEAQASADLLRHLLPTISAKRVGADLLAEPARIEDLRAARLHAEGRRPEGVGIVEGWRGTIVHRVEMDPEAVLTRWKIVDPSFLTWPALPLALSDTIVPDFPLTNKSFNLSYAGNDL
jgi:Ni,Fe-hydrogenase III large subunit/Ni,Fe-hydrogenase III component G